MTRSPRWVFDTNIVVAGLLWQGPPRRLLDQAIDATILLYSSPTLIDELTHTLGYPKFSARIQHAGTDIDTLVGRYTALASLVLPRATPRVVERDPDDDHVIACALAAKAQLIVSGDKDLLVLDSYRNIAIVTPAQAIACIEATAK